MWYKFKCPHCGCETLECKRNFQILYTERLDPARIIYDQAPFFICKKCRRSWSSMTEMEDANCFPDLKKAGALIEDNGES